MEEEYELAIEEAAMKLGYSGLEKTSKKFYCVSWKEMMHFYQCIKNIMLDLIPTPSYIIL